MTINFGLRNDGACYRPVPLAETLLFCFEAIDSAGVFGRPWDTGDASVTSPERYCQVPINYERAIMRQMMIRAVNGNVAGNRLVTMRVNGVNTTLAGTILSGTSIVFNDTEGIDLVRGDLVSCILGNSLTGNDQIRIMVWIESQE